MPSYTPKGLQDTKLLLSLIIMLLNYWHLDPSVENTSFFAFLVLY